MPILHTINFRKLNFDLVQNVYNEIGVFRLLSSIPELNFVFDGPENIQQADDVQI